MAPREGTVRNDQHRAESDRPHRQPAGPADLYRHDQDAAHDTVRRRLDEGACTIDDGEGQQAELRQVRDQAAVGLHPGASSTQMWGLEARATAQSTVSQPHIHTPSCVG
jgi:hypothetical protein